jgi:hypothetical protein
MREHDPGLDERNKNSGDGSPQTCNQQNSGGGCNGLRSEFYRTRSGAQGLDCSPDQHCACDYALRQQPASRPTVCEIRKQSLAEKARLDITETAAAFKGVKG